MALNPFVDLLDQLTDAVKLDPASDLKRVPDRLVHHYTSIEACIAMLSGEPEKILSELWATSLRHTNDTQEYEFARTQLLEHLAQYKASSENAINSHVSYITDSLARCIKSPRGHDVFGASFSRKTDDLNQWRAYADAGRGVCLTFSIDGLHEMFPGMTGWIQYSPQQLSIWANRLIIRIQRELQEITRGGILEAAPSIEQKEAVDKLTALALPFFSLLMAFYKSPAFEEESEFRVAYVRHEGQGPLPVEFRASRHRVIPFVRLLVDANGTRLRLPLTQITLGPGCKDEANLLSFRTLLDQGGLRNVDIDTTKIPFLPV